MINLNTPSDVLWATLSKEYEKAKYWMIKQYGGEKRYEAMRDDLLRRCAFSQCTINSKPVYYTSQEGNRWICFENATYYPDSYASNAMPSCFCYYETASSIGLFMVGFSNSCSNEGMNCVLIFTPHFFQRYAERMGVSDNKDELLMKFTSSTRSFTVSPMDKDENGHERIAVRITTDCTGYGIRRSGNENVFEVRTILTDAQLSKAQSARTERVRSLGDLSQFEPVEITARRLEGIGGIGNITKAVNDRLEKLQSVGVDTSYQVNGMKLSMTISMIFMKMGIASLYDADYWEKYGVESHEPITRYLNRMAERDPEFKEFPELVKTVREIAARMGVRKFAWREFAKLLMMEIYKFDESKAAAYIKEIYPM